VCHHRFTTYERVEPALLVLKRSGRVEAYQAAKLRAGLEHALAGRPVAIDEIDRITDQIESVARRAGQPVPSEVLGREALSKLRDLDEVAYLRFASVHKGFRDATDFQRELTELDTSLTDEVGTAPG
jgi:transcriptional repressor NrdR